MRRFVIPILFFLVTLVFYYPLLKGQIPFPGDTLVGGYEPYRSAGIPNKGQGVDIIREAFPWKSFIVDSLQHGQIPFWNPHNFSGNPLMANFQSAVFYPFNALFFIMPFLSAWSALIFLGPFLAGLFTFLFLRELKLSKTASFFGGVVFAFSSYMTVWLEYGNISHTYLWLPLALYCTERLLKNFTKKNLLFLILTLWASILGGYIQGFFYILVTLSVYFLSKISGNKNITLKKIIIYFSALLAPILLSLFQVLQTIQILQLSSRGNYSLDKIERMLNPIWYTITVIIPDFFGNPGVRNYWYDGTYIEQVSYFGVIPFILALAALVRFKKYKEVKIFGSLFIILFLIATDLVVTKYIYTLPIPMLSTTVPTRILGLFEFCGAILAAFGLEMFLHKKGRRASMIASMSVLLVILAAFTFTILSPHFLSDPDWLVHMQVAKRNTILPLTFATLFLIVSFLSFRAKSRNPIPQKSESKRVGDSSTLVEMTFGVIIIFLTIFDLFYFFHKITPFSPQQFVYPQTPVMSYLQTHAGNNRFWGYGSGYIQPNFQTYDKTYSPEGDDPLHIKWYTEFLESSKDGKPPVRLPRPDANIIGGYGPKDLDGNYYRQKVLNLLGIKYVLNKDELLGKEYRPDLTTFNKNKYTLVWQEAPWQIYENLHAVPRTFLTREYIVVSDKDTFFKTFFDKNFNEATTVILDLDPKLTKNKELKTKNVTIISYAPNKVVIKTNADKDALLFISDTYYPEWKAKIDMTETKIYKADYAFRAVVVPAGEHMVTFSYEPKAFKVGLLLSGLFSIFLMILFLKLKK